MDFEPRSALYKKKSLKAINIRFCGIIIQYEIDKKEMSMAILGNTLKEKREALGLSIQEVSDVLEIQERFIKALEEENLDIIPNEYYIKAFMKQYGDFLKINGDKLLANFYKEQEKIVKEQEKNEKIETMEQSQEDTDRLEGVEIADEKNAVDLETIEQLKLQQEMENLSDVDKPTEINLHLSDYEYEENLKAVPKKDKWHKGVLVWPLIILLGVGVAYLVHATFYLGNTKNATVVETTTTRASEISSKVPETTSTAETTTETTTTSTSVVTTIAQTTTTRAPETTQATTVSTMSEQTASAQQEYPSGNQLTYVKSAQDRSTTYGLGADYKNYTGTYNFKVTVTEPTWIRVTIHHKVIYEGTISSQYSFYAYNTADNVIIKTGISNATKITMNNTPLNVPTDYRVHTVEVDLKR